MTLPHDTDSRAQVQPTLDALAVAALLAISLPNFQRRRQILTRDHGFPRHLPGLSLRWSRAQVLAWIASNGVTSAPAQAEPPVHDLVSAAQAALHLRYGGLQ